MSSEEQIKANRLNGQKSTGPRTPAGKAKVSANALKHGLTARSILLPNESPEEHSWFRIHLMGELDPTGPLEAAIAEQIVEGLWRSRRVPAFEANLHTRAYREALLKQADMLVSHYGLKATREIFKEEGVEEVLAGDQKAYQDAERQSARARTAPYTIRRSTSRVA